MKINKNISVAQFIDGELNVPWDGLPPKAAEPLNVKPCDVEPSNYVKSVHVRQPNRWKKVHHTKRGADCTCNIGAASELAIATWLMLRGYVVYRNYAPVGCNDLVVIKDNVAYGIDVKTGRLSSSGTGIVSNAKTDAANVLVYCPEDNSIWFDVKKPLVPLNEVWWKNSKLKKT